MITNQIGDTTIKIIDHEIKRYVVRVKEFKDKSENLKNLSVDEYEQASQDLRKDEKKLASIIKK